MIVALRLAQPGETAALANKKREACLHEEENQSLV
jgi:hypothetical protein